MQSSPENLYPNISMAMNEIVSNENDDRQPDTQARNWATTARHLRIKGESGEGEARVTTYLLFRGKPVHALDGPHGRALLEEQASNWNESAYVPERTALATCRADVSETEALSWAAAAGHLIPSSENPKQ